MSFPYFGYEDIVHNVIHTPVVFSIMHNYSLLYLFSYYLLELKLSFICF